MHGGTSEMRDSRKRTLMVGVYMLATTCLMLTLWLVASSHQRGSGPGAKQDPAAPPRVNNKGDPSFDVFNAAAAVGSDSAVMFRGHRMNELALACHSGDVATAEQVLERNPRLLNSEDPNGFTAIIIASAAGQLQAVQMLIAHSASMTTTRHTALRAAAMYGHALVLRALLDAGADPNQPSARGLTPLMGCARAGHADACRLLLARGARVADVNEFGETAVDVAQNAGHLAMVTLLNTHDEQEEGRDQEEGREY